LGEPALEPKGSYSSCTYRSSVDEFKEFYLTVEKGGKPTYEAEITQNHLCGDNPQPVSGLGDSSCSANNTVMVLKKDLVIIIMGTGTYNQDSFKNLAEKAVSRIP